MLALVEAGVLRGFSIEFVPIQERMEGPTRILVKASVWRALPLWTDPLMGQARYQREPRPRPRTGKAIVTYGSSCCE